MRITNQMMRQNLLSGLRGRMESISRAASEASTGRRIRTVSDDPVDASQIMRMESQVRDVEQYRRNGTFATTRLSTEDVALSSLLKTLQNAKDLVASTTSADPNDPSRQAALAAVKQYKEQMVALGNTKVGNEYIFGGTLTTTPPFQADGTFVGDSNVRQVTINDGVTIDANHSGGAVFGTAMTAIDDLITQLTSGTPAQIQATLSDLQDATQVVMVAQGELGVRLKNIQQTGESLAVQHASLLDRRDAIANVDPAEAIIRLQSEQAALERAYAVINRVMSATLTEYLR